MYNKRFKNILTLMEENNVILEENKKYFEVICNSCKFYLSADNSFKNINKYDILRNCQNIKRHINTKYHKKYLEQYTDMKKEEEIKKQHEDLYKEIIELKS